MRCVASGGVLVCIQRAMQGRAVHIKRAVHFDTMNKGQYKRNDAFSSSCEQCDVLLVTEFSFVFKGQCKVVCTVNQMGSTLVFHARIIS